jgi:hypothetical protein
MWVTAIGGSNAALAAADGRWHGENPDINIDIDRSGHAVKAHVFSKAGHELTCDAATLSPTEVFSIWCGEVTHGIKVLGLVVEGTWPVLNTKPSGQKPADVKGGAFTLKQTQ